MASGGAVAVTATATDSLPAHTVAYLWAASCPAALGGNGAFGATANQQAATWTAPANLTGEVLSCTITVTVNDGAGGKTASASYSQGVNSIAHTLTITALPGGNPNPVTSGAAVALTATATDSLPAHTVAYAWTAVCPAALGGNGSFGATAGQQHATWTAPANLTGEAQSCTITVTVNDGAGGKTASACLQPGRELGATHAHDHDLAGRHAESGEFGRGGGGDGDGDRFAALAHRGVRVDGGLSGGAGRQRELRRSL